MEKYDLVKDKLYQILNYNLGKARECKDLIEFSALIGWFIVGTIEVINKSDLAYSDKEKLIFWMEEEMTVLRMFYIRNTKN